MLGRKPRVLLVTSPYHSGVVEAAGTWMPLAMVYVGGEARAAGAEVEIYDAMSLYVTHDDIARKIAEFKPDIVGTSAITATEPDARVICATAKAWNPAVRTVVGNVHATYCWDEILRDDPNVDFVIRGEGERTISELVQAVADFLRTDIAPLIAGHQAFKLRVGINALDLVTRQLALASDGDAAEHARLRQLLGADGSLIELNRALSDKIAKGEVDLQTPGLLEHLWRTTMDKLAVDQPNYASYKRELGNK